MNSAESLATPIDAATRTILEMAQLVEGRLAAQLDRLRLAGDDPQQDAQAFQQLLTQKRRRVEQWVVAAETVGGPSPALPSITRIAAEIERMGEYLAAIQTHTRELDGTPPVGVEESIISMGKTVRVMLNAAIDAFSMRDPVKARVVRIKDSDVDRSCQRVFARLAEAEHRETTASCARLNLIARSIAQIGDHATQIADSVLLMVDAPATTQGAYAAA